MLYNSPRELGIGRAEFHRIQASAGRKLLCNPQRTVSNVGAKLEHATRLHPLDDVVEELALLVTDVDEKLLAISVVVDRAYSVRDITRPGVRQHVVDTRRLSTISHLPFLQQPLHSDAQPNEGPSHEWEPLSELHPVNLPATPSARTRNRLATHDAGVQLLLGATLAYFKPSFLPDASTAIDSRMRLSRVSGRLAM